MHKLPAFKTQSSHLQHCIGLHVCDVDTYPPEKKTHKKNNNKKQTKNNNNLLISHHETIAPLTQTSKVNTTTLVQTMSDLHRPTVLNSLLFFANNTAGFCFFNCLGRLYAHNDWLSSSRSGSGWRERSTVLSLNLIRSELTGNRCSRLKVCSMLL